MNQKVCSADSNSTEVRASITLGYYSEPLMEQEAKAMGSEPLSGSLEARGCPAGWGRKVLCTGFLGGDIGVTETGRAPPEADTLPS